MKNSSQFNSFKEFYPYYQSQHRNPVCRRLHFIGTGLALFLLGVWVLSGQWRLLPLVLLSGYGFAWVGHFFYERNQPATFTHPLYSLLGDLVEFINILRGRVAL